MRDQDHQRHTDQRHEHDDQPPGSTPVAARQGRATRWRSWVVAALLAAVVAVLASGCKPGAGATTPASPTTATTVAAGPSRAPGAPAPGAGPSAPPPSNPSSSGPSLTPTPTSSSTSSSMTPAPTVAGGAGAGGGRGCTLSISLSEPREGPRRTTIETLTFTNTGATPCAVGGERPVRSTTAQFVGPDRSADVGKYATGYGGDLQLAPGESTATTLTTSSTFGFDDDRCEPATVGGVRITPPADAAPVVLPARLGEVCTAQALGPFLEVGGLSARG